MNQCALCASELSQNPYKDGENAFCCNGCLTVFRIVGSIHNFREHPLFQEALQAGIIANPQLVEKIDSQPSEKVKCHLHVEGMWCPSCAEAIRLILMRKDGMISCLVDYATDLAAIIFDPKAISKAQIIASINKMGYSASEFFAAEKSRVSRSLWLRFSVAVFCAMNIMMFSYPLYIAHFGIATDGFELALGWFSFVLSLPLISYTAWPMWKRWNVSLRSGSFGMETLVLIGILTAWVVSTYHLWLHKTSGLYFDSMAMLVTFVLLGKILEKKAKFSAKETLLRLTRCIPKKGCKRLTNGEYSYVPLKEIIPGDIIMARLGEKIVLDGMVCSGEALVDEAVMTGEARLVRKFCGSTVIGGSILKQGNLIIEVTKDQHKSLLGQILTLVEEDFSLKTTPQYIVDQIVRIFVPFVLCLSLWMGISYGPLRALVILMIACPCSIGIAIPLAHSRLLYLFAQKGALVRNRSRLYRLAANPLFVFDKTGTLTEGKFQVLNGIEQLSQDQQAVLKGLATHSTHPICLAITEFIHAAAANVENVSEILGRGMVSSYKGKTYLLGSEKLMAEKEVIVTSSQLEETVVYFACDKTCLATLHLGDRLRERLPRVDGVILSGDTHSLVSHVAKKCHFKWGKGGLDPLEKREEIKTLKQQGQVVVMVGDGVNDAPAMAAADLSISVVSATDLAVEVSDILMTTEHLDALPTLCTLTAKCQAIIFQNLFWTFFYNGIGIILACMGLMNPFFAALAMACSSLCVTLNSLRLR